MRKGIAVSILGVVLASAACAGESDKEVLPPVVLGMLETTPAAYDDGEMQIFQVSKEVRMPFRRPNDDERPSGQVEPYPRAPFHVAPDTRITVRYTLSNLEDATRTVELLIDPWNEFVRYQPGVSQGDEETIPNFSGIDKFFVLPPKGRVEGIFTPDDMAELATDLATAMALQKRPPPGDGEFGGPGLYNRAFNIQNRSSEPDLVLGQWLPKGPVAAIVGFDLGLRTYEQAKIAVEIVIDVEDVNGERIVKSGEEDRQIGRPGNVLTPPAGMGPM